MRSPTADKPIHTSAAAWFRTTASVALVRMFLPTALMLSSVSCAKRAPERGPSPGAQRSQIPDPAPDLRGRPTAPISLATDACADRLHAISGPLLYYYHVHRGIPERLEDLRDIAGPDPDVQFTCPVSGRPYVYNPAGVPRGGDRAGVLIIYDAQPSHSGFRWGIAVEPPQTPGAQLVTKVVAEPEVTFHDAP